MQGHRATTSDFYCRKLFKPLKNSNNNNKIENNGNRTSQTQ